MSPELDYQSLNSTGHTEKHETLVFRWMQETPESIQRYVFRSFISLTLHDFKYPASVTEIT